MNDPNEQGTAGWKLARCGKIGASSIGDLMAKTKSGPSASRANLIARLVCERLTGVPQDTYVSAAMQHGTETEPAARAAYELAAGVFVEQTGWVQHPDIEGAGASPDGLVNDDGLLEVKCPSTATHMDTLLSGFIDRKYLLQMQWQMAVCGRHWCDFWSFDPRMPEHLQGFKQRVKRDDKLIAEITGEVLVALAEVEQTVKKLQALKVAA